MSLNIVRKNSGSPFQLQRSMVDQGGSGGAYESGGYNPEAVYNNDVANATIESLGKVVGAAISSRTAGDENKSNVNKKSNLERKKAILETKKEYGSSDSEKKRYENKIKRVSGRIEDKTKAIDKYKASMNNIIKKED